MIEMKNVRPAFEACEGDLKDLGRHQEINCNIMFDMKLGEKFRRQARLVTRGHKNSAPSSACFASVIF